jgi:hypothetical protein
MSTNYIDIGDRIKMIFESVPKEVKDVEELMQFLAGAIAFHLDDYAEQEIRQIENIQNILNIVDRGGVKS